MLRSGQRCRPTWGEHAAGAGQLLLLLPRLRLPQLLVLMSRARRVSSIAIGGSCVLLPLLQPVPAVAVERLVRVLRLRLL